MGDNMSDDNKLNLLYFDAPSMRELYATMDEWQKTNRKRFQSVSIQRDGDQFCCIALTNPSEVVIVSGSDGAWDEKQVVVKNHRLFVDNK